MDWPYYLFLGPGALGHPQGSLPGVFVLESKSAAKNGPPTKAGSRGLGILRSGGSQFATTWVVIAALICSQVGYLPTDDTIYGLLLVGIGAESYIFCLGLSWGLWERAAKKDVPGLCAERLSWLESCVRLAVVQVNLVDSP